MLLNDDDHKILSSISSVQENQQCFKAQHTYQFPQLEHYGLTLSKSEHSGDGQTYRTTA